MPNQITPYHGNQIIASFDDAERAARAMAASGFFSDARQASQAIVKILAGQELGFGPFASMTGVSIIQGKPAIGANLMAAAVKRTGKYNYRVLEMTNDVCELEFYEAGQSVGKSRFTMADAQAAGLGGKDNWKKYPRNMLFARALSNGQRWYAPDVFNGATVYTPDEMGATVNEEGQIIDAQAKAIEQQADSDTPQDRYIYEDGTVVSDQATPSYLEYVQEHGGKAPANVHNLRNWYKSKSESSAVSGEAEAQGE
jgi:hypothetical protein